MENRKLPLQVQLFQGPIGISLSFSAGPDVTTTVSHGKKQSLKKMARMVACSKGASKNLEDPEAPLLERKFQEGPKTGDEDGRSPFSNISNFSGSAEVAESATSARRHEYIMLEHSGFGERESAVSLLKDRLGFNGGVYVDSVGKSGGLALLWRKGWVVDLKSFSPAHIDSFVTIDDGKMWRFTGFYGHPQKAQRGSDRVHSSMSHFRETVEDCDLQDLGFRGAALTWKNGQDVPNNIQERLDRVLVNEVGRILYAFGCDYQRDFFRSDHRALHVVLDEGVDNMKDYHGDKQFRFEPLWRSKEEYKYVVLGMWFREALGGDGAVLMRTLDRCAQALKRWETLDRCAQALKR
ncbi:hypothetical protein TIFTF001_004278 [Ficus carica]|uniref:Uncharacterized protein n=1 Tax=Ficus carica TaxID=3494 RepID=A0AA87ZKC4_FICCA|nr:hypothetical protein TIFTF001_004278 [Ficus carica]